MHEFVVLVPQTFNDGSPISPDTHETLRNTAVSMFDGLTIGETVQGYWENEGTLHVDINQRWYVASDDIDSVRAFANVVRILCDQLAVYVARTADTVLFVEG